MLKTHHLVKLVFQVAAAGALSLALISGVSRTGQATPVNALSARGSDCGDTDCWDCEAQQHYAKAGATAAYTGPHHSACWPGGCWVHNCPQENDVSALTVAEALEALRTGSRGSPAALAARYPKHVTINRTFGAVQVRDCGGNVVAHIPLSYPGLAANRSVAVD